jgi:MFS family permease
MNLERFDWRAILSIAVFAMLMQQAFSYVCQIAMPILADRIADDFGISRAWLGFYLFLQNIAAIIGAMGCGGFILRYGALRISQWCLILMGSSLLVVSTGILWIYPIGAILLGMAAVSTPASSHILARVCPPRLAPVIFSIKQTGVPVGSLIGGLLIPLLLTISVYSATFKTPIHLDAYGTAFVTGLIVYLVAFFLQPIRAHFDADRNPSVELTFSGVSETMKFVISHPQLRDISFGAFAFGGLQSIFSGFFILFLIDGLDYSEAEAGSAFAISAFTAVGARIFWGYLGSTLFSARTILGGIGMFGTVGAVLTSMYDASWSYSLILWVAILYNVTSLSWHGILLAEIARLSPPERVGGVTGGVLSFTSVAMMIYPAVYGGLLAITDSYGVGFLLCSIPALVSGIIFLRPPIDAPWVRSILECISWCFGRDRLIYCAVILVLGVFIGISAIYLRSV